MVRLHHVASFCCLLLASAAPAQNYDPRHEAILRKALASVAEGRCPPEIMTPMLQYECEKQLPSSGPYFRQLGAISTVIFKGTQQSSQGPAEVYVVRFAAREMLWMVATDPDGKLSVFWSPG